MGEAKCKAEVELASGIIRPTPPKQILKTWDFCFSEEAHAAFTKIYDYLRKRLGNQGPQCQQELAERMLALGMKFFLAEIAKEERGVGVQVYQPGEAEEISRRLQAAKEGKI